MPPITQGEYDFYEKNKLVETYNTDKDFQSSIVEPLVDSRTGESIEPNLQFHEFLFLLALIAMKCVTTSTPHATLKEKLIEFYVQKLRFKKPRFEIDLDFEQVL